jgi:hypothetical protein
VEAAAAGGGGNAAEARRQTGGLWENQTIKSAKTIKESIPHLSIPPYHTTPKKNQNNQNTGSIPVNIPHCSRHVK